MKVSNAVADNRSAPFPAGTYEGEITEVEDRFANDDTTLFVRIVLGNNTPADDRTGEVGKRTHREDICFMYKGDSLFDMDEINTDTPYLFQRAAGLLASLAVATGHANRDESDIDFDADAFGQKLRDGDLNGSAVKFSIRTRARKRKDTGEKIDESSVNKFAAV